MSATIKLLLCSIITKSMKMYRKNKQKSLHTRKKATEIIIEMKTKRKQKHIRENQWSRRVRELINLRQTESRKPTTPPKNPWIINIRNEKENHTLGSKDIRIMRGFYETIYANKYENLD